MVPVKMFGDYEIVKRTKNSRLTGIPKEIQEYADHCGLKISGSDRFYIEKNHPDNHREFMNLMFASEKYELYQQKLTKEDFLFLAKFDSSYSPAIEEFILNTNKKYVLNTIEKYALKREYELTKSQIQHLAIHNPKSYKKIINGIPKIEKYALKREYELTKSQILRLAIYNFRSYEKIIDNIPTVEKIALEKKSKLTQKRICYLALRYPNTFKKIINGILTVEKYALEKKFKLKQYKIIDLAINNPNSYEKKIDEM